MITPLPLMRVSSEFELLVLECDPRAASEAVSGWSDSGLVVRVVRGRKMRTLPGVFDEFAAALQFPWYFGENADAFDECMADLSWLPPHEGYVIVITEPAEVLCEEAANALSWLVTSLARAGTEWARPVDLGEWWDRPEVPFHVVLQPTSGDGETATLRWASSGGLVSSFPASRE